MQLPFLIFFALVQGSGPTDVPPGDPPGELIPQDAFTAVRWLNDRKVVDLTSDGKFQGGKPITREELVVWLYNATDGKFGVKTSELADSWLPDMKGRSIPSDKKRVTLAQSSYAAACLNHALFLQGLKISRLHLYDDDTYKPERPSSRFETALSIFLVIGPDGAIDLYDEVKGGLRKGIPHPPDVPPQGLLVHSKPMYEKVAKESISVLCDGGILHVYKDSLFRGPRPASRYEAAAMIYRWIKTRMK